MKILLTEPSQDESVSMLQGFRINFVWNLRLKAIEMASKEVLPIQPRSGGLAINLGFQTKYVLKP